MMKILFKILLLLYVIPCSYIQKIQAQGDLVTDRCCTSSTLERHAISPSNHANSLSLFTISLEDSSSHERMANVDLFIKKIQIRYQDHTREKKVKKVFRIIHDKYLKQYKDYSTFEQTVRKGTYDCLTGSVLYAYVYKKLGFSVSIQASLHHVYLLLEDGSKTYLIESTDPLYGLVDNPNEIQQRIKTFNKPEIAKEGYYQFTNNYHESITFTELAGLYYYNVAINHFNQQDFVTAKRFLQQSLSLYDSNRIQEILKLTNLYLADQANTK